MQSNTIDHTKGLFRFVAYVIYATRDTLLTMDEEGIQQIVPILLLIKLWSRHVS